MSLLNRADGVEPTSSMASVWADHGDRLAVVTHDGTLTYAELTIRVEQAAERLGAQRRLVLIAASNQLDPLICYLAALRGGLPVMLVPGDRATSLGALVDVFDPDIVVAAGAGGWAITERRSDTAHELHPDLAVLLSTSGSTGASRFVRLSLRNLDSNAFAIAEYLRLTPSDRGMTSLPMHYCYGLSVINSHLVSGAGVVLTDHSVVDRCFWDRFRQHEATSLAGVPYTFELLDRVGFESMGLPSLRYVTQAGGRLDPAQVQRYAAMGERAGWELFVMYGQTEATARMAYLPPHLATQHPGAIGIPIPGGSFDLEWVDECNGADEGEVVYRGDNVMLGYADGPHDLALGATVEALRTGDLARRTPAGLYEIVGRRSRMAKILGLRIDLQHLEETLAQRSVTAMCTSDDHCAIVAVTRIEHEITVLRLLQDECGLPASRVAVVVTAQLPRLTNGKADYATVRQLADKDRAAIPPVPADTSTVESEIDPAVRACVARILPQSDLSPAASFVSLGGDSLSYVEMSIALEETLGELPADWPTMPLRDLVPRPRPSRAVGRMETTIVLRALSIVLVVGTHVKLFTFLGGAHLLLGIAGYNFARFQVRTTDMLRSIARIAVPSMIWLAIATGINDRIHLAHVLLINGWIGGDDSHGGYWYVEAIVQILVPLVAVLSIARVRRWERAEPFGFAFAALAAGLLVRFNIFDVPTVEPRAIRPHDIAWIFAIGWVAAHARSTTQRALLSAVIVASVPGYFGAPVREAFVATGLLLVVWAPTMPLIRVATRPVGAIAAASLYIYLTHWQVFPPLRAEFGPGVALVGSVSAGILAWSTSRHISQVFGRIVAPRMRQGLTDATASPGTIA